MMRLLLTLWVLLLGIGSAAAADAPAESDGPLRVYTSEEAFGDVVENVRMAIIERGMLVSGTLHLGDMLNRTASDLGFSQVFTQAESVEFCSALISHEMAQASPLNIANCPFTIAVFVKADTPGKVFVAYRLPQLAGEAEKVSSAILELLDGIAQDSI